MKTNEAILGFSQSEKIKAGLIWISNCLELLQGLTDEEKKGAEKIVNAVLNMIGREIGLARTLVRHEEWDVIEPYIDKTLIMINSGVGEEAFTHLSKALSKVTNIGQQSMSLLKEKELL
ncbi:MAG: hypothetical protein PVG99_05405 [Desulfobacteraceae bacterium]|jgi:hypothetical protein